MTDADFAQKVRDEVGRAFGFSLHPGICDTILAHIEPLIRADERARVVAEAITVATVKIRSKEKQFGPVVTGTLSQAVGDAIRAALGGDA